MNKKILFLSFILIATLHTCSKVRTRQFIVSENKSEGVKLDGWIIEPPSLVAFKDIIKFESVADTNMFWLTVRAKYSQLSTESPQTDLLIDSVRITFSTDNEHFWRRPTRVAPYQSRDSKYYMIAFDFYGDQGITIPLDVDSLMLEIKAVLIQGSDSLKKIHPVQFKMIRDESIIKVPLVR